MAKKTEVFLRWLKKPKSQIGNIHVFFMNQSDTGTTQTTNQRALLILTLSSNLKLQIINRHARVVKKLNARRTNWRGDKRPPTENACQYPPSRTETTCTYVSRNDRLSFVARFFFRFRSRSTSTAFDSSGTHSYQIFRYLYTFPQLLSSKNMLDATTSHACSFLHCPFVLANAFSTLVSHRRSFDRPAGTRGHVSVSSRPQKTLWILMSSYCLHCTQPFSPSQINVKF